MSDLDLGGLVRDILLSGCLPILTEGAKYLVKLRISQSGDYCNINRFERLWPFLVILDGGWSRTLFYRVRLVPNVDFIIHLRAGTHLRLMRLTVTLR